MNNAFDDHFKIMIKPGEDFVFSHLGQQGWKFESLASYRGGKVKAGARRAGLGRKALTLALLAAACAWFKKAGKIEALENRIKELIRMNGG